jgi:two-component system, NarL family, response regulator LiaR
LNILRKLGVQSRTQAALHAVRTGLVSTEELSEERW